ncbi:MAG: hypothetical protein H7Y37_13305 [Anaerolineae bacterium]|nr:hypothetical protein [Gloeobacterales cyanobacterium ES-bin-313]
MKHAVLSSVAVLLIAVPIAAKAATYPANIQKTFLSGCQSGYAKALKQQGMASKAKIAQPLCTCVLKKVSAQMSLADFKQANRGLFDKKAGKTLDPVTQEKVNAYLTMSTAAAGQCLKSIKV